MEVLSSRQMRRVDRRAIDTLGIPGLTLMEAAGNGVAACLLEDEPAIARLGVAILCGPGNNGGDGFVVARRLAAAGVRPLVVLLAETGRVEGDAAASLAAARRAGIEIHEAPNGEAWDRLHEVVLARGLVVDAMLGTGIRGGARGVVAQAIETLNTHGARVASIDLPSGLDADSHRVAGAAVRAERTYTLCRPKLALVLDPAARLAGSWSVVPIGIPDEAVAAEGVEVEWFDAPEAHALVRPRDPATHKGELGHLLGVAGSRGKAGAAVLLGRGALRAGAGLVTIATPVSSLATIAAQQAELMTEALAETTAGTLALRAAARVRDLLTARDALAIGPGLGTAPATRALVLEIVRLRERPAVVDADALNAIALARPRRGRRREAPAAPLVLTPHPGEAARLLGSTADEVQDDRLAAARRLAEAHGAIVVLKGHRTIVADPQGRASINASGNSGMATAGAGDVLTGVIGALLASGLSARDAARLGVFAHGAAGDLAASEVGTSGLIASDIAERLPAALRGLADAGARGRVRREAT